VLFGFSSSPSVTETPPPPVSVSRPLVREAIDYDDYDGRIAAVETIEAGTYKASLDSSQAQKSAAEAGLELAKKEYDRTAVLVRTRAASREELDVWMAKQGIMTAGQAKASTKTE